MFARVSIGTISHCKPCIWNSLLLLHKHLNSAHRFIRAISGKACHLQDLVVSAVERDKVRLKPGGVQRQRSARDWNLGKSSTSKGMGCFSGRCKRTVQVWPARSFCGLTSSDPVLHKCTYIWPLSVSLSVCLPGWNPFPKADPYSSPVELSMGIGLRSTVWSLARPLKIPSAIPPLTAGRSILGGEGSPTSGSAAPRCRCEKAPPATSLQPEPQWGLPSGVLGPSWPCDVVLWGSKPDPIQHALCWIWVQGPGIQPDNSLPRLPETHLGVVASPMSKFTVSFYLLFCISLGIFLLS